MADSCPRAVLELTLGALAEQGRSVGLWLRDDDASDAPPALLRLLDMAGDAGIEPLIAAIPEQAGEALARALEGYDAPLAVHGFAHANHAPEGEKSSELGSDRPLRTVLAELVLARERLVSVVGDRVIPVLVPPWNRMAPELVRHLPIIGFSGVSAFGSRACAEPVPGVVRVNTHLDLIDWRGSRGTRPQGDLITALAQAVSVAVESDIAEPLGILTHHRVHDDEAWRFLETLLAITVGHPGVQWLGARAVFAGADAE